MCIRTKIIRASYLRFTIQFVVWQCGTVNPSYDDGGFIFVFITTTFDKFVIFAFSRYRADIGSFGEHGANKFVPIVIEPLGRSGRGLKVPFPQGLPTVGPPDARSLVLSVPYLS